MANGVFNIARGRVNEYVSRVANDDPANSALVVLILKAAESDATLEDYDDLDTLLDAAGNTEADFTNYARVVYDDTDLSEPTPDDTNNRQESDMPDPEWASAGGAANNTTAKIIVCYDPDSTGGDDTALIPLTHHDFVLTTNGGDISGAVNAAGFYRAA
jgi:hypothetical protein